MISQGERTRAPLSWRMCVGNCPKSCDADETTVRPPLWFELPNPSFRLIPAVFDCLEGNRRGTPTLRVQAVATRRTGKQQQRFAEDIELKLFAYAIADDVGATWITRYIELCRRIDWLAVAEV